MNLRKLIIELEEERNRLDQAILALERLSRSISKRGGRPARWVSQAVALSEGVHFIPPDRPSKKSPTN